MERALRDKKAITFFLLPAMLFFVVVILLPILQSAHYSLLEWDGVTDGAYTGLANYRELFGYGVFWKSVGHSFILAAMAIFIQIPLGLVLALILAGGVRGEKAYRTIYFLPVIISTVVIGQLWMKVYHPSYGMLNAFLELVHLPGLQNEWLANPRTALLATFVPITWQYIGYHMLVLYTAVKSISPDLLEAAQVDGASRLQVARRITLPMIRPMVTTCVTFALINSLKSFDLIYLLTRGGPIHATEVPSTLMYINIFTRYRYGYGSAMAVFIIVECLVLAAVMQRLTRREVDA